MKKKFLLIVLVLALLMLAIMPAIVSAETIYDCRNDGGLIGVSVVADLANAACVRVEHERGFGIK